jgi:hypothetical protein
MFLFKDLPIIKTPRHSDMMRRAKKSWCKELRSERESKYPY